MNNVMKKVLDLAAVMAITMTAGMPTQVSATDLTAGNIGTTTVASAATHAITIDRRTTITREANRPTSSLKSVTEHIDIIVQFKARWQSEGKLGSNAERQRQRTQLKRATARFIARLKRYKPRDIRTYKTLPFVAMTVDRRTYTMLLTHRDVVSVQLDELHKPTLGTSLPVVGADNVKTSGYGGAGQTVVIIDTGVDVNNNPSFANGQIVAQGCFNRATSNFPFGETISNICPDWPARVAIPATASSPAVPATPSTLTKPCGKHSLTPSAACMAKKRLVLITWNHRL